MFGLQKTPFLTCVSHIILTISANYPKDTEPSSPTYQNTSGLASNVINKNVVENESDINKNVESKTVEEKTGGSHIT